MENSDSARGNGCCCFKGVNTSACRLASDQFYIFIFDEMIEAANSIGTTTHTGNHSIGQPAFVYKHLFLDFFGDNCLKITDNGRERMRSHNRTETIMCITDTGSPFTHSLGYSIFEGSCACFDGNNFSTKQSHTVHIQRLTNGIFFSHKDNTFHAHQSSGSCRGDTMLSGSCFSNQSSFAHLLCKKRLTKYGRVFEVYKFRTMKEENSIHKSVTENDDRITKVGHIIRKFRIDELPQLINVLKSDMSIVGPRPEMLENVEKYTDDLPEFRYRLRAKAGLTGLAQIYGKYNTSPRDKLIMDLAYIQQYSVWLDLKLILRTALVLLTPEESTEAFEDKKTEEKP